MPTKQQMLLLPFALALLGFAIPENTSAMDGSGSDDDHVTFTKPSRKTEQHYPAETASIYEGDQGTLKGKGKGKGKGKFKAMRKAAQKVGFLNIGSIVSRKKSMHRSGSNDSLQSTFSVVTTTTTATAVTLQSFSLPDKIQKTPFVREQCIRVLNGNQKIYTFNTCESEYLRDTVAAVALAGGERYLDISQLSSSKSVKPGLTQDVTIPTEGDAEYRYTLKKYTISSDGHTVELAFDISDSSDPSAQVAESGFLSTKTVPVLVIAKLSAAGSVVVANISETAQKLRGYDEQLPDVAYYAIENGSYRPGLVVLPSAPHGLAELIIARNEQEPRILEKTIGQEHPFRRLGGQRLNDRALVILGLSLAQCICEIQHEGYGFITEPKLSQFGLYHQSRPVFLRPMDLRLLKSTGSEDLSQQMLSYVDSTSSHELHTFPPEGIIYWLGKVFAMLLGVESIYKTEIRSQLDFDDPSFTMLLALLKQTSFKEHVIAHLDQLEHGWKSLKPTSIAGRHYPKVSEKYSPSVHMLALCTYMLRDTPKNRPTIKQVLKFINAVREKHGIFPDSP